MRQIANTINLPIVFAICLIFLNSCTCGSFYKCQEIIPVSDTSNILGKWHLLRFYGGFAQTDSIVADQNRYMTLDTPNNYSLETNGKITVTGNFSIYNVDSVTKAISFTGYMVDKFIKLRNDTLFLNDRANDAYNYVYKKVK